MRFPDGAVGCDDGVGCVDGDGGCVVVQSEKVALDSGWSMESDIGIVTYTCPACVRVHRAEASS
jgi:hypothetical protein